MEKPIDLVIEDFEKDLANLINTQKLPLSVITIIVNKLCDSINEQYKEYKIRLRNDYEQRLAEEQLKQSSLVDANMQNALQQ